MLRQVSRVAFAIIFAILMLAGANTAFADGPWTISGTVISAEAGGGLLEGIGVEVHDGASIVATASTDALGHYSCSVPDGVYTVHFDPSAYNAIDGGLPYRQQWYSAADTQEGATALIVDADHPGVSTAAGLLRWRQIYGEVRSASNPSSRLESVTVEVYSGSTLMTSTITDEFGDFAVLVPDGDYHVRYDPSPLNSATGSYFAPGWYNYADGEGAASNISVWSSSTVANASDFLRDYATLSGYVTSAYGGAPLEGIGVTVKNSFDETMAVAQTDADGYYVLHGLTPGQCIVYFDATAYNAAHPSEPYYCGLASSGIPLVLDLALNVWSDGSTQLDALRISGALSAPEYGGMADGATVELWDDAGLVQTATVAGGEFAFYPRPGSYRMRFDPAPWNANHIGYEPLAPRWWGGSLATETATPIVVDSINRYAECNTSLSRKLLKLHAYNTQTGDIEGATFRLYDDLGHETTSCVTGPDGWAWFSPAPEGTIYAQLDLGEYNMLHGTRLLNQWYDGQRSQADANGFEVPYYASQELTFWLIPPAEILGTVSNAMDGASAPDVDVVIRDWETESVVATGATDAEGGYDISVPPYGAYSVQFDTRRHNQLHVPALVSAFWASWGPVVYWDAEQIQTYPGQQQEASVQLPLSAGITGTVVGKAGVPIEGVNVQATLVPDPGLVDQDLIDQIAASAVGGVTDSSGSYELDFSWVDSYVLENAIGAKVHFSPSYDSGYLPEFWDDRPDAASADLVPVQVGTAVTADATLSPASSIAGVVTSAEGVPMENVSVLVRRVGGPGWSWAGSTNPEGHYLAHGLEPGDYQVSFDPTSYNELSGGATFYEMAYWDGKSSEASANILTVPAATELTDINAVVREAVGTASGRVTDAEGNPVQDVSVSAFRYGVVGGEGEGQPEWVEQGPPATTDANGEYTFPRLHAGDLRFRFTPATSELAPEWFTNRHVASLADTVVLPTQGALSSIDATLEAVGHVRGSISDDISGAPIEGVPVHLWASGIEGWENVALGYSDADGHYDVSLGTDGPVRVSFGDVPGTTFASAGSWHVSEAYADKGDIESADNVDVGLGTSATVDASLAPAASIEGTVSYDSNLGDVYVDVLHDGGSGWQVANSVRVGHDSAIVDADSDGDGYPDWVDPWPYDPMFPGMFMPDSDGDGVPDFIDPSPDNPAVPELIDTDGDGVLDFLDSDIDGDGILNADDPDPMVPDSANAGSFRIDGLAPGAYKVRFRDADHYYITQHFDGVRSESDATTLALNPGETRSGVDAIMVPGGTIVGSINPASYWEGDEYFNLSSAAIYERVGDGWNYIGRTQAGADGAFEYGGLESGSYAVVAYTDSAGLTFVPEAWDNAAVPGFVPDSPGTYSPPAWVTPLPVTEGADTVLPETMVLQSADQADFGAPVSSVNAPSGWVNHDLTLRITATDAADAPVATYGAIDDGPLAPCSTLPTITAEGETTVRFYAADAHGNREATKTASVKIDKTPPTTIDDHVPSYAHTAFVRMYGTDMRSGPDETRFVFDGGPVTIGAAVTTTETGTHTLSYWSTDRAGNSEPTKTVTFNVGGETNPPQTTATAPVGWAKAPVEVVLTATDDFSGIDGTWYSTDGTFPKMLYMLPFQIAEDGVHVVKFRSIDGQGNAEAVKWIEVWADGTPPVTTAHLDAATGEATVTLSATDALSGVAGTRWSLNGAPGIGTIVPAVGAGHYSLGYSSIDAVGNREATKTLEFDVYDDTTSPVTTVTAPAGWVLPPAHVSLGATDDLSGVAGTFYSTDGSYPTVAYGGEFTVAADGKHTVRFRSVDAVGNSETPKSVEVWVDGAPPSTSAIVERSYGKAKITLPVSDTGSGVARTDWTVDSVPGSGTVIDIDVLGSHTIEYWSTDVLGNVEPKRTLELTITKDVTPPVTVAQAPAVWVKPSAIVTLTATDDDSGVDGIYYSTDGAPPRFRYFDPLAFSSEGTTTVKYRAVDRIGNAEAIKTLQVRVDGTAPVTTSDLLQSASEATVTLAASDPLSGVALTEFRLDGATATAGTLVLIHDPGWHTVWFRSTDAAGNAEGWKSREVMVAATTGLDLSASATSTVYPAAVRLTAHLLDEGGVGIAGQVDVQMSTDLVVWTLAGSATSTDGTYTLSVAPTRLTYYRANFAGTASDAPAASQIVSVAVGPTLSTPAAPTSVKSKAKFTVSTKIRPKQASGRSNVVFRFYRLESGVWVLRKSVRGTNAGYNATTTKVSATTSLSTRGSWKVIAYHPADEHLEASSTGRRFKVN